MGKSYYRRICQGTERPGYNKARNASLDAKVPAEAELPPIASASTQPKAENDLPELV